MYLSMPPEGLKSNSLFFKGAGMNPPYVDKPLHSEIDRCGNGIGPRHQLQHCQDRARLRLLKIRLRSTDGYEDPLAISQSWR